MRAMRTTERLPLTTVSLSFACGNDDVQCLQAGFGTESSGIKFGGKAAGVLRALLACRSLSGAMESVTALRRHLRCRSECRLKTILGYAESERVTDLFNYLRNNAVFNVWWT